MFLYLTGDPRLIAEVENGAYNNKARLPDLIELGRVMFRMDALDRIAREKVRALGAGNRFVN
ncbi:NEL-type E3 ubiquitin ligase domain-containing protein [Bradyrhizobium sp. SEMIA]|uniref:NEL-type E3 ubiquitin ligase domain-containing protein n=1 Tax=Bradyrhizobium sp. SEMIA TaxID=2597515 RepID=UPI0018A57880|nr:NEL-type E3 ubiquitin ligase domain-containing protein [Bradyrhizobium sp. SEMIA]QOG21035.1 hypothetical protein FOM02_30600 [Bradyrhizobium sp. SEMIA]